MGKISPVSAKYIIHAIIEIDGVVDKPDVIGAIFGQTEGLLGADLELRELQRSGRIGRIEVNTETRAGKTKGEIIIPSSLDKAETVIIGAALEIIQRIGPCNAKIKVHNVEDVRVSKRQFVIERAKELLKELTDKVLPDSQEIADEVAYSVRVMEITEYGRERLPAGPAVEESDEIIVVEGRADVLNLLKHGFKNAIAINGTSIPETIKELCKKKVVTVFVDGDRGGDLIIKEFLSSAEIDFVTKAPDGKEVEEITKKEIHKALRSKIAAEQTKLDFSEKHQEHNGRGENNNSNNRNFRKNHQQHFQQRKQQFQRRENTVSNETVSNDEKEKLGKMMEDLIGTKAAYLINKNMTILGKVPTSELIPTLKNVNGVYALVVDGELTKELVNEAEKTKVKCVIGMESQVKDKESRIQVLTVDEL